MPARFLTTPAWLLALGLFAAVPLGAQAPAPAPLPPWMEADTAARTVRLVLEVTPAAGAPSARINGYREGQAQIVVPLGWTVQWEWRSADSTDKHSLVLMAEREKLPTQGGQPVFPNALTRMLTAGLPPGEPDRTTFEADQVGWYWLLCGVPEHALRGEWIGLKVDGEAKGPGLNVKAG